MVQCCRCWKVFPEADIMMDKVGEYHGQPAYQAIEICPYCHNDELVEVERMDDKDVMYNFILENYEPEDIIEVMAELLGDSVEAYERVYARLNYDKANIHEDKEYLYYASEHCWIAS